MKKNQCTFFAVIQLVLLLNPVAAEETKEDKITLPDVTTVVSGDSLTAGKNAVPDFSDVVPDLADGTAPLPELPDAQSDEVSDEPEADLTSTSNRNVYAEGLIGGGFPGFFSGDFSVYKSSGDNPFRLAFSHVSANGYGTHSAANGYFDSKTELSGTKKVTLKNAILKFNSSYDTVANGMQSDSSYLFDNTQQTISGQSSALFQLPMGFSIALDARGNWYSRYAGINTNGSGNVLAAQETGANVLFLSPAVLFSWSNEAPNAKPADFQLAFDLSASYEFESFLSQMDFPAVGGVAYSGPTTNSIHRGQFNFGGSWKNKIITLEGDVGIVVGTSLQTTSCVAPFNVSMDIHWFAKNTRPASLVIRGGLESYLAKYSELEKKYLFTSQQYLPSETSDWFAEIKSTVPVSSSINFNAACDWRTTAFGNGMWEPLYSKSPLASSLYDFKQIERTSVHSAVGFSFLWKLLTVSANWKANWLYVPATENEYEINATCSIQPDDGYWGIDAACIEALGTGADCMPIINAGAFIRLNNSLRLAGELNDAIKLCTGEDRTYANSVYVSRAGSVTLLVKFFF